MNTAVETPVKLTTGALAEIRRIQEEPGFDKTTMLRIGVKGGGCSGLSYVLGFDKKGERDNEYDFKGVTYIIEKSHEMYLAGMEIDWENGLNNRGFTFTNPNASSTCGCGSSFGV